MTNICNLSCINCCTPTTGYPRGFATDDTVKRGLEYTVKGQYLAYHRQGEPLLHSRLLTYIRWAHRYDVLPRISTNGLLLTENLLGRLLDAGLKQLYVSMHNRAGVDAYLMAADYLVKRQYEILFVGQVLDWNKEHVFKMAGGKLELDPYKKSVWVECTHAWAGNVAGRRREYSNDEVTAKLTKCPYVTQGIVNVRWDGSVVGCCLDSENLNELGHIRDFDKVTIDHAKFRLCRTCDWVV